jgi:hypothetical protein
LQLHGIIRPTPDWVKKFVKWKDDIND